MSWSCGICDWIASYPYITASTTLLIVGLLGYLYCVIEKYPTWNLKRCRVILTGGSSGIGLCLAQQLVSHGAIVTIIARDEKKLNIAIDTIRASNPAGTIYSISADVADQHAIQGAVDKAQGYMKGLDLVIGCAGVSYAGFFTDTPISEVERLNQINYLGNIYLLKACVPILKKQSHGRIVLVGSIGSLLGVAGYSAYCATKFALRGLAESLHMELKPYNIAVSVANPPDTDTPMLYEENKIKPLESRLIADVGAIFKPEPIAKDIIKGIIHWKFNIYIGFDGYFSSLFTPGAAPCDSIVHSLMELVFGGFARCVFFGYRYYFNHVIARVHGDRISGKVTTITGEPPKQH